MKPYLLPALALASLTLPAAAGEVRVTLRGTVGAVSNASGPYTGVAVTQAAVLSFEIFLTSPPPTGTPGDLQNYAIDLPTMSLTFGGAITVLPTAGTPTFGMADGIPVSDGVQGPNCQMGGRNMTYGINYNSTLFVSTDPLGNLGTKTYVPDGSYSEGWLIQGPGAGTYVEIWSAGTSNNITIERVPVGTPYCFGDGSGTACPCIPVPLVGAPDKGCPNSFNAGGGKLTAYGLPSIATDTLVMTCTTINNGGAVVFQGTNDNGGLGTAFGDGLRCAAGTIRRMKSHAVTTNSHQYPDPAFGDNAISIRGAVLAPGDRWYQGWYRSGLAHCDPAANYNLTNALRITWLP